MRECTLELVTEFVQIFRVRLADLEANEAMTITVAASIDLFCNLALTAPSQAIKDLMIKTMKERISSIEEMPLM